MNFENHRDFYQKALLPIGLTDFSELKRSAFNANHQQLTTHWLIALDGEPSTNSKEIFHWKVKVYPSNSEGAFKWNNPFCTSSALDSFDKAIELARSYEEYSRNDQLIATKLQNRIN